MAKYDMQVLVGVGIGILILMGISDSKKRLKEEKEDGTEPPRPPGEMEVAQTKGQNLIAGFDQEIKPSMNAIQGRMDLSRAKDIEKHRINRMEQWRAQAAQWISEFGQRFAVANQMELPKEIQLRQQHIDAWFEDMAGKQRPDTSPDQRQYILNQNAYMMGNDMAEDPYSASAQRKIGMGMDVYPNEAWRDGAWDTKARQNSAGHTAGMDIEDLEQNFGKDKAAIDWDKTAAKANELFGHQGSGQPEIDFAGHSDSRTHDPIFRQGEVDYATNDDSEMFVDKVGRGVPTINAAFGGNDPKQMDTHVDDPIPAFAQPGRPSSKNKPPSKNAVADDGPVRDGSAGKKKAVVQNMGSLEDIRQYSGPGGLPPARDGKGGQQVFNRLPSPSSPLEGGLHALFDRQGKFQGTVSRAEIEKQITIGLQALAKKVESWAEGMEQYRRGIAGRAEIDRLIAMNETGEGTLVLSPQDIREMKAKFNKALSNFSRSGVSQFGSTGRGSYQLVWQQEQLTAANREDTPLRRGPESPRKRARTETAGVDLTAAAMSNPKLQRDFTQDPAP